MPLLPPLEFLPGLVSLPQQYTGLIFVSLETFYSFDTIFQLHFRGYIYPLAFSLFFSSYGQEVLLCLKRQGKNHTKDEKCNLYLLSGKARFATSIVKHTTSSLCSSLACAESHPRPKCE